MDSDFNDSDCINLDWSQWLIIVTQASDLKSDTTVFTYLITTDTEKLQIFGSFWDYQHPFLVWSRYKFYNGVILGLNQDAYCLHDICHVIGYDSEKSVSNNFVNFTGARRVETI